MSPPVAVPVKVNCSKAFPGTQLEVLEKLATNGASTTMGGNFLHLGVLQIVQVPLGELFTFQLKTVLFTDKVSPQVYVMEVI